MRSKYFLRGMGVGILVTVMIFAVSLVFYEPSMSDEEIIEKATALGMVRVEDESGTDSLDDENTEEQKKDSESESESEESGSSSSDSSETGSTTEEYQADSAQNDSSNTDAQPQNTDTSSSQEKSSDSLINFTVSSGEGSFKISENLYRAGLIDDPNTFNKYLEDMGYDDTIRTGTYNIPSGSSYEEIANAISH